MLQHWRKKALENPVSEDILKELNFKTFSIVGYFKNVFIILAIVKERFCFIIEIKKKLEIPVS